MIGIPWIVAGIGAAAAGVLWLMWRSERGKRRRAEHAANVMSEKAAIESEARAAAEQARAHAEAERQAVHERYAADADAIRKQWKQTRDETREPGGLATAFGRTFGDSEDDP